MTIINVGRIFPLIIFNYIRNGRAIGIAFAMAILINAVLLAIVVLSAPVQMSVDFYFSEVSPSSARIDIDSRGNQKELGPMFSECFWMPLDDSQATQDIGNLKINPLARVHCLLPDPVDEPGSQRTGASLAEQFDSTPGWAREGMVIRIENKPAGLRAILWIAPFLVPVLWLLLRNLDLREDLKRAANAILNRPWILLATPAAALVISSPLSLVIASDPVKQEHAVAVLTDMAPPFWLLVFVLPLIEEAVFRQWLYVRIIDRLPVWLAAGASSWAFMLLHILNPHSVPLAVYLPTMFGLGMTLFWIRHRFQSFSLAAIAHIGNNGLFLGLSTLWFD